MLNVFRRLEAPQFPFSADRAQGGHLAVLQGLPRQGSDQRISPDQRVRPNQAIAPIQIQRWRITNFRTWSNGTRASATRSPSSDSTASRRSSSCATISGCSATWRTRACPSHYPHWSYGKSYEKLKTLYDHGVSGLPYEMVINSDPALAYLMRDNTLLPANPDHRARLRPQRLLQEQLHLHTTRAALTIEHLQGARRCACGITSEDPSIGVEKVEHVLDAAHALSLAMPAQSGDPQAQSQRAARTPG